MFDVKQKAPNTYFKVELSDLFCSFINNKKIIIIFLRLKLGLTL